MGNLFSLFLHKSKKAPNTSKPIQTLDIWEIPSCHQSLIKCKNDINNLQTENKYLLNLIHQHKIKTYTGGKRTKRKYGGQSITYNNK